MKKPNPTTCVDANPALCAPSDQMKGVQRTFFPPTPGVAYDREYFLAMTEKLEGSIPHMYMCTENKLTIGVGCRLFSAAEAQEYGFVHRDDPAKRATPAEIAAEFAAVQKLDGKRMFYWEQARRTTLILPAAVITQLRDKRLQDFEAAARGKFHDWMWFPCEVKMALLSMYYGLGPAGLNKYHRMLSAVWQFDWRAAAKQCDMSGPSVDRRAWTRQLFGSAALFDEVYGNRRHTPRENMEARRHQWFAAHGLLRSLRVQ